MRASCLLFLLFFGCGQAQQDCPPQDCPQCAEEDSGSPIGADAQPAPSLEGAPVIGISGYVILPGTRGDKGLGRFRATRTYRDAVHKAGGIPVHLLPVPERDVPALVARLDGLVLAGGPDIDPAAYSEPPDPSVSLVPTERQEFDFALAREAEKQGIAVLGICLGSQELNVVRGGSLVQDIPTEIGGALNHRQLGMKQLRSGAHEINIFPGTRLQKIYGAQKIRVNSAHHQASDVLGKGLVAMAKASDGVIEAFEDPSKPFFVGVQYHPEMQNDPEGLHDRLFEQLIEAARAARANQAN